MLHRSSNKNITSGNLFLGIVSFAIPIFLSQLIQTLFTAADTAVVGNFTIGDETAVASIGASNPVISLLVGGFVALGSGASIVIARAIGAKDTEKVDKAVNTSLIFAAALGVFLMVMAMILSVPVLRLMNCPESCFDSAVLYMRLYMLGTPMSMVYNFGAGIIRAEGDSTRPLIYIIISGLVNVVTNIVLCLVLPNKVAAVAIATALSHVVSAILVMHRLTTKKDGMCKFSFRKRIFDWKLLGEVLRFGIPMVITASLYPIANLQINPVINAYGPANIAGVTAANNIDGLCNSLQAGFNNTCVTFISQNIGAHKRDRVKKTLLLCLICSVSSGLVLGTLATHVFSEQLLGLFVPGNAEAIRCGQIRMFYVTGFMWISAYNGCIFAAVQAFGYPTFGTLNNLFSVLVFRIIWMNFIYVLNPSLDLLYVCFTVSWSMTALFGTAFLIYAYRKYRKKEALYEQEHPQIQPA